MIIPTSPEHLGPGEPGGEPSLVERARQDASQKIDIVFDHLEALPDGKSQSLGLTELAQLLESDPKAIVYAIPEVMPERKKSYRLDPAIVKKWGPIFDREASHAMNNHHYVRTISVLQLGREKGYDKHRLVALANELEMHPIIALKSGNKIQPADEINICSYIDLDQRELLLAAHEGRLVVPDGYLGRTRIERALAKAALSSSTFDEFAKQNRTDVRWANTDDTGEVEKYYPAATLKLFFERVLFAAK